MDLFEARAKRRTTQWDLRQKTGIHQSKISLIERGYVIPSPLEKMKIAKALGYKVQDIFPADQEANHAD
jgi:DNA-binding XRE family transcriptional regulator